MTYCRNLKHIIKAVADGDGFTTEIDGVLIQKCDKYGKTDTQRRLEATEMLLNSKRQELANKEETINDENKVLTKTVLSTDLINFLDTINHQIDITIDEAVKLGCPPLKMRTTDGNWVMAPLLCAKAQVLHSLILLED